MPPPLRSHDGTRPLGIVCCACHQQFFAGSLAIHQKTCFQRHGFVEVPCPTCRALVQARRYHAHIADCEPPASVPQQLIPGKEREREHGQRKDDKVGSQLLQTCDPDGRVRCHKCDRAFHPERIAKHQSVCVAPRHHRRQHSAPERMAEAETLSSSSMSKPRRGHERERGGIREMLMASAATRMEARARAIKSSPIRGSSTVTNIARGSKAANKQSGRDSHWQGRDTGTATFDVVHREYSRVPHTSQCIADRAPLSTSTATSGGNPLATTHWMTVESMR